MLTPLAKMLGVTVESLLGQTASPRPLPPGSCLGQVFEAVSKLPRRQQQKVNEMAEGFMALHQQGKAS